MAKRVRILPEAFLLKEFFRRRPLKHGFLSYLIVKSPVIITSVEHLNMALRDDVTVKIPFQSVIYEITGTADKGDELQAHFIVALELENKSDIMFIALKKEKESFLYLGAYLKYVSAEGVFRIVSNGKEGPFPDSEMRESPFYWCVLACVSLNEATFSVKSMVPASMRNPRAAAVTPASGWEYRIVDISKQPEQTSRLDGSAGTHASPRWHMRRGHWRRLRSGKQAWVRACAVGSEERGGVIKDYITTQPPPAQIRHYGANTPNAAVE